MKKFFKRLDKLYTRRGYCVKYYLQASTFSFDVFKEREAFLGTPSFRSEVYFHTCVDKQFRKQVMKDISQAILNLETGGAKVIEMKASQSIKNVSPNS